MDMNDLNKNNSNEFESLIRQMKVRISELEEQCRNYQNILDENYKLKELLNQINNQNSNNQIETQNIISQLTKK
jgi:hypothetical protein